MSLADIRSRIDLANVRGVRTIHHDCPRFSRIFTVRCTVIRTISAVSTFLWRGCVGVTGRLCWCHREAVLVSPMGSRGYRQRVGSGLPVYQFEVTGGSVRGHRCISSRSPVGRFGVGLLRSQPIVDLSEQLLAGSMDCYCAFAPDERRTAGPDDLPDGGRAGAYRSATYDEYGTCCRRRIGTEKEVRSTPRSRQSFSLDRTCAGTSSGNMMRFSRPSDCFSICPLVSIFESRRLTFDFDQSDCSTISFW